MNTKNESNQRHDLRFARRKRAPEDTPKRNFRNINGCTSHLVAKSDKEIRDAFEGNYDRSTTP